MNDLEPFRRGQEATEEARRELEALREDVRAIVREEVQHAGTPRSELQRMVADAVRKDAETRGSRAPVWRSVGLVAVGAALGFLAGALGYGAMTGGADEPVAEAGDTVTRPPAAALESPPPEPPAPTPQERAATYDSLLQAGATELEPLVGALESGGAAGAVLEAVTAWRAGDPLNGVQTRRLHDALVQGALNALTGSSLSLDGLLTRDPCGGQSCGALLDVWEARGPELGMPAFTEDAASDIELLAVAEKVLVLSWVEALGG